MINYVNVLLLIILNLSIDVIMHLNKKTETVVHMLSENMVLRKFLR